MVSAFNYARNLLSVAFGRQPTRPLLFSYYVTHRCELNCRYCSDGDGKQFKADVVPELSTAEARRLLSILRRASDVLDLTGGEPLLRDDLEEILTCAHAMGFMTVLNTKGIGLATRPDIMRFTDVLVLSVDALDVDALSRMIGHTRATAAKVLEALDFAVSRRRSTGTKVVLSTVATPANMQEVPAVVRFALQRCVGFQLSPEIIGTTVNPALPSDARYRELVSEVIERKRAGAKILGVPQYLQWIRDFRAFRCYPLLMPVIRPDGRMYYPCLEKRRADINVLDEADYAAALKAARRRYGPVGECSNGCHIFCHMGLSLLQRNPASALGEILGWRN